MSFPSNDEGNGMSAALRRRRQRRSSLPPTRTMALKPPASLRGHPPKFPPKAPESFRANFFASGDGFGAPSKHDDSFANDFGREDQWWDPTSFTNKSKSTIGEQGKSDLFHVSVNTSGRNFPKVSSPQLSEMKHLGYEDDTTTSIPGPPHGHRPTRRASLGKCFSPETIPVPIRRQGSVRNLLRHSENEESSSHDGGSHSEFSGEDEQSMSRKRAFRNSLNASTHSRMRKLRTEIASLARPPKSSPSVSNDPKLQAKRNALGHKNVYSHRPRRRGSISGTTGSELGIKSGHCIASPDMGGSSHHSRRTATRRKQTDGVASTPEGESSVHPERGVLGYGVAKPDTHKNEGQPMDGHPRRRGSLTRARRRGSIGVEQRAPCLEPSDRSTAQDIGSLEEESLGRKSRPSSTRLGHGSRQTQRPPNRKDADEKSSGTGTIPAALNARRGHRRASLA